MNLSVDELILQIRKENNEAKEMLISHFEPHIAVMIRKYGKDYKYLGYSREDLVSLLQQETLNAVYLYEFDKSAFFAFWKLVITRTLLGKLKRNKLIIQSEKTKVSLDSTLSENLFNKFDPLDNYILHDEYESNLDNIEKNLDSLDQKILKLWSENYSYEELSEMFNLPKSKISYIIYRSIKYLREKKQ